MDGRSEEVPPASWRLDVDGAIGQSHSSLKVVAFSSLLSLLRCVNLITEDHRELMTALLALKWEENGKARPLSICPPGPPAGAHRV
jgi:hypothetical protein